MDQDKTPLARITGVRIVCFGQRHRPAGATRTAASTGTLRKNAGRNRQAIPSGQHWAIKSVIQKTGDKPHKHLTATGLLVAGTNEKSGQAAFITLLAILIGSMDKNESDPDLSIPQASLWRDKEGLARMQTTEYQLRRTDDKRTAAFRINRHWLPGRTSSTSGTSMNRE